jgi:transposase
MRVRWELSDAQWQLIEPVLRPQRRAAGRGRPWRDTQAVLNGILWVLGTGAQGASCQRNIRRTGPAIVASSNGCGRTSWNASLSVLAEELHTRGKLEVVEAFIDASFTGAKKGASRSGLPSAARGRKSSLADDHRLPLAISIESASPHESQLVEGVLGQTFLDTLPAGLIGDNACDRDRWDRDLAQRYSIPMIAPHRGERREPTQDGRSLRRYRRRWRVQRLVAWLHHFRRLVIRWEYHAESFLGMVHPGCIKILLRRVFLSERRNIRLAASHQ